MWNKEIFEAWVPKFIAKYFEAFHLLPIRVKAAFRRMEFYTALSDDAVGLYKNEKSPALIMLSLRDNRLRIIQERDSTKKAWDNLNSK